MIPALLAYLLVLLLAAAFFLFYPGYLSFYALALFLALPLLSLLLALLCRRRYALGASCSKQTARRGETVEVRFALSRRGGEVGDTARLTVRVEPLLYPQLALLLEYNVAPGADVRLELPLLYCGWYRVTPLQCRLPDWLGGVALPLGCPPPLLILSLPRREPLPAEVDPAAKPGAPLRPRLGGGPGEEYELRPYRPGDPVNAIHWKLTAKQPSGDPVLRQTLEPVREPLAVSYDHVGPPEELDRTLDRLEGLVRHLLDKGESFTVYALAPSGGAAGRWEVDCPNAWDACYQALSALPAAQPDGRPAAEAALPGPGMSVKRIHLTADGVWEVTGR